MKENKNYALVIPARFQSSRLPGKPLVEICGKPLVQHVWERCCLAIDKAKVFVATDDKRIADTVLAFGGQYIMTSSDCLTGTDRLAEANRQLNCDFLINVQGDEPLVNPDDIRLIIEKHLKTGNVTNAMCAIQNEKEFFSLTVPKVVVSNTNRLLYMSRSGIPGGKNGGYAWGYKQVCIYAFSREQLAFFSGFDQKMKNEEIEDIEILRFLEADYQVDMVEVENGSVAVDIPEDIDKVTQLLKKYQC